MSKYSDIKEIYKDLNSVTSDSFFASKIVNILLILSLVGVCTIFLFQQGAIRIENSVIQSFVFPEGLHVFLSRYSLIFFIAFYLLRLILQFVVNIICVKTNIKILPIWLTIKDIWKVCAYFFILLKVIEDILLCLKGEFVESYKNGLIHFTIIAIVLIRFIHMIWLNNKKLWYYAGVEYTPYFDSEGKRIAKDDEVVYKNRVYRVFDKKGEWFLSKNLCGLMNEDEKLEDAVVDERNKVKVCYYGMGEKDEK